MHAPAVHVLPMAEQDVMVVAGPQAPIPSHLVSVRVMASRLHVEAQVTLVAGIWHAPAASQPLRPQVAASLGHLSGSGALVTAPHMPMALQAWQA